MRNLFEKKFSTPEVIGLIVIAVMGMAAMGYALTTVPHKFSSGTTAKADEVNENFQALADAIDGIALCVGNDGDDAMVKVGPLCVDVYEASVWSGIITPTANTLYGITGDDYPCQDHGNDCKDEIYARSIKGVEPSRHITWFQAQQACANSYKRLLTNAEWQMAASGTPDTGGFDDGVTTCNTDNKKPGVVGTGVRPACFSGWNIRDMVGNVEEWVADWTQGNASSWFPALSNTNIIYGNDLLEGFNPATEQGDGQSFPSALVRGGFYNIGSDAGVFAMRATNAPSNSEESIGFRCAR